MIHLSTVLTFDPISHHYISLQACKKKLCRADAQRISQNLCRFGLLCIHGTIFFFLAFLAFRTKNVIITLLQRKGHLNLKQLGVNKIPTKRECGSLVPTKCILWGILKTFLSASQHPFKSRVKVNSD